MDPRVVGRSGVSRDEKDKGNVYSGRFYDTLNKYIINREDDLTVKMFVSLETA